MAMADAFEQRTIRESLLGMVVTHLGKGNVTCGVTHQIGCELVALLSAYREEDRRLFPEVYLLGPYEDDLLPALAPGTSILQLGEEPLNSDPQATARKAAIACLKVCAALAIEGWCVYLRRESERCAYGLFRPAAETYAAGAEATLSASGLPAALLRNSAENTVEIINSAGERLEISLTTATPSAGATSGQIVAFARVACSEVPEAGRERAMAYLGRLLTDHLRTSHGALLGVVPFLKKVDRGKFSDGVILAEPIPLVATMLTAAAERSTSAARLLRSQESLLRGMIASDGVTILGTDGSIKAFRVFVHPPHRRAGHGHVAGGARIRAFEVLRGYVPKVLSGALFRSQDGRTEVVP
jgi:hypothetical protein